MMYFSASHTYYNFTILLFLFLFQFHLTSSHTRLECPPPRSGKTGEKDGPCDAADNLSLPPYPLVPGALNTITWLESIPHPGAPARFALSLDGDDSAESFETCLLLDHVPHDELSSPTFSNNLSWHRSSITLWIPDVYCERCHLQLMTVMSDDAHRLPVGATCGYEGAVTSNRTTDPNLPICPVVYHSCSPVSINGTVPRNEIDECNTTEFEERLGWPLNPRTNQDLYDYSTYYFKGDPGMYNQSMSYLMAAGAPIVNCNNFAFCDPDVYFQEVITVADDALYTRMEGTCAAMVTKQVIPFELGVLPSDHKDETPSNGVTFPTAGPSGSSARPSMMTNILSVGLVLVVISFVVWR